MIDKNFWKDKKVLVTGHSGFKGFWMFLLLKKLGSNVFGVSIEKNSSEIYKIFSQYEKIENEEFIDIRDKVYEHPDQINTEENSLGSFEFYGASKVGLENIIDAFNNDVETRNKISRVRSGNVLGGGDGADNRLLTDIISSIKSDKNIYLRNPDSIRPWQFVLDSVGGYLLVAQENFENNLPEKYNLNSEKADNITVFELTKKLVKKFESPVEIIIDSNDKYSEAKELRISSKKAAKKLNWKNFYKPEEFIENIFLWENIKSEPGVIEATNKQVIEYIEKASR